MTNDECLENDEARMTNDEGGTRDEMVNPSFDIWVWSFVILARVHRWMQLRPLTKQISG